MAILVWQNSLVFHSLDKLTSIFIHVFPPLTLHLYRSYITITVGAIKNETLVFVNFSAQDASILKISMAIIKRRS